MAIRFSTEKLTRYLAQHFPHKHRLGEPSAQRILKELMIATRGDENINPSTANIYRWLKGARVGSEYLPYLVAIMPGRRIEDFYEVVEDMPS